MSENGFKLRLIKPSFDSALNEVIVELEASRRLVLRGDTPAPIFFQLKEIFHLLESLGSARIEGNHTTLADYIETKVSKEVDSPEEDIQEIQNIEAALAFVDEEVSTGYEITHSFIKELHQLTVLNLSINQEGDRTPGKYRSGNVRIAGSKHTPPDSLQVQEHMDEILKFVNSEDKPIYDLMKVALAHHRFAWAHPFTNGNGRVVRLFTYALLLKFGFEVQVGGRVLNPTAVFCNDRERYYEMLEKADRGTDEGLEEWTTYALSGIKHELSKVDKLTRHDYLKSQILYPAITEAIQKGLISKDEDKILRFAADIGQFKANDLKEMLPQLTPRQITYQITKLNEARMIRPVRENARTYMIDFTNSVLIRGVMKSLEKEGFTSSL
ncbi:Fic family protein [Aliiglaciecola sp. M165]|uniref:Fic family protein n=1 Tax=Aliiglaciecola sp. M165 TaxID=2593649 RepID=UPI00117F97B7|nr:Fic family protein [Aliiglaciecola sp. M165]TRY30723.1 Fic family protein [Aliiglaciecola sp. M165]